MGKYLVDLVVDDLLPDDHDWVLMDRSGVTRLLVKASNVCDRVLEEGWKAYLQLLG